jgi:hypothetical protein
MLTIGLTGKTGAGKSTVAAYLKEKGCYIIDGDVIARQITEKGSDVLPLLQKAFGDDILDENGNFTTEFESDPTKYLIEVDMKEDEFYYENVSLDSGDYYAVFYITDIYGNRVNSNLVSVNK